MPCSIHVEVARPHEGVSLTEFLRTRGLSAGLVETGEYTVLEIGYAEDEEDRLARDVSDALRTWLAEHELPLVPSVVGERFYTLRPPGE
jgi:hypothetical protein